MSVTLSELQRRVFDRMDEGQSQYISVQQCNDVINEAYSLLWGIYVDRAPVYMEQDTVIQSVVGQRDYLLPSNFRRLTKLYQYVNGIYLPMTHFERDNYSLCVGEWAQYRYQLLGREIRLTPTPMDTNGYFELWYTPHYSPLVNTTDTLDPLIFPGHEQWLINQAVIILKVGKEEQPCDDLRQANQQLQAVIENDLLDRDDGANRHIVVRCQTPWEWNWNSAATSSAPPGYVQPVAPNSSSTSASAPTGAVSTGVGDAGSGGAPPSSTTSTPPASTSSGSSGSTTSTSSGSSGSTTSTSSGSSSSPSSTPSSTPPAPMYVYQNALQNSWRDYSYGTTFDAQPDTRVTGGQARAAEGGLPQYKGFNFNNLNNNYLNVGDYTACNMDIKCDSGSPQLVLQIDGGDNGSPVLSVTINPTTSWATYTLPFTGSGTFTNIRLSNFQSATTPRILINNVDLIPNANPMAPTYTMVATDPNPATTTPASLAIHVKAGSNKFYDANGNVWMGRGWNVPDTRMAGKAREQDGSVPTTTAVEWKRRIGWAMDMGADWFRIFLDMESAPYDLVNNATYLASLKDIVSYVGSRGGHCMLTCGVDYTCAPSTQPTGQPTTASITHWTQIATSFRNSSHVWFGLCNEPQNNDTPSTQAAYLNIVNQVIAAIRATEARDGVTVPKMIVVQGVSHYSRHPTFFNTNPATDNAYPQTTTGATAYLAYEEHNYETMAVWNQSPYNENFPATPMQVPMILGEFGFDYYNYSDGSASYNPPTINDIPNFINACENNKIPYTAWILDFRDPPAMMVDHDPNGYGAGKTLELTTTGTAYINALRQAKGISGSVNSLGQVQ